MSEIKAKPKKFIYRTNLKWIESKKALLSGKDRPAIEVSTPFEFRGHAGIWTPEELFVASVNICIMTTFLYYAEKRNFRFISYESSAEGILERKEGGFMFSTIEVNPGILVESVSDVEIAGKLLELSEKNCLITNSIKSRVYVKPEIKTKVREG